MTEAMHSLLKSVKSKARIGRGPKDGPKREAPEVEYQVIDPEGETPEKVLDAIMDVADGEAETIWKSFRRGFNLYAYDAACDPLASVYQDSWTDGQRKSFRQMANSLAAMGGKTVVEAASALIAAKLVPEEAEDEE